MTGTTWVPGGILAMLLKRKIAASNDPKKSLAPVKKKLPMLPFEKLKPFLALTKIWVLKWTRKATKAQRGRWSKTHFKRITGPSYTE